MSVAPARGDDCGTNISAGPGAASFELGGHACIGSVTDSDPAQASNIGPAGTWQSTPVCEAQTQGNCVRLRQCPDGTNMLLVWFQADNGNRLHSHNSCADGVGPATPDPGPSQADILHAFQQIPLPESTLTIQPPGGATLVNFDTNFYTNATPFDRTLTLLGHHLHLKIKTHTFTWHFGDHTDTTTTKPGAAYPTLTITHRYLTKGTVTPSVDTTWTADYQLDNGPWTPVNGTVTRHGPPQQLTIKSATPTLVG